MGAPTNAAYVKKVLANSEPSTHGVIATVGEERLASNLGINCFALCRSNLLNNIYAGTGSESPAKVLELRAVP